MFHNIIQGWEQNRIKQKEHSQNSLPYTSEDERAQLIEMLLEEVIDSRDIRRKFVSMVVKRDPELLEELIESRQVVIDV